MKDRLVTEYVDLCHELVCMNHGLGWTEADGIREKEIKQRLAILRGQLGLSPLASLMSK
ncbi:hypothetical protein [Emergencia sp. 1XD21-10]|uniref:hypothetical protein n=1 Tax=Emergencia sp. 1XD21-10 TaxID=2304569 RepID=UPI001379B476|nr:hypothetical protein [Emergencia sp. 1XD21-10]